MNDTLFGVIFGSFFGGIGLLFFCVGFFMRRREKALRAEATPLEGEIVEVRSSVVRDDEGDETTVYSPVFRIIDDHGEQLDLPTNSSSNIQSFNVGDVKMVLRVPGADYVMQQDDSPMNFLTLMFMGMGGLAIVVGLVVAVLII